jgi:hypothetical protein
MAALTADTIHKTRPNGGAGRSAYIAGGTIYAGSLVGVKADGLLYAWEDVAGFEFVGLALIGGVATDEIRCDTSGTILREVNVDTSDQTSVGELVESPSSNPADFTLTAPVNVGYIGRVVRFHSGDSCDVELFTPAVHLVS